MTPTRYSPKPIAAYGMSAGSSLLKDDIAAWNLAYLSWDMESNLLWPDAYFSTHVRRTLQYVIEDGFVDIGGTRDPRDLVRSYLLLPPPRAVYLMQKLPGFKNLALYKAYGEPWRQMIEHRSRTYREPFEPALDFDVLVAKPTADLIAKLK